MINLDNYIKLDVSDMDREVAVLIYDNKVYMSDCNHQCALEEALYEENKSLELDLETDEGLEKAIDITYSMSKYNDIAALDIYRDYEDKGYLISHFVEHLGRYWGLIEEVAIGEDLTLGTFTTFPSQVCNIFIEQPNED